MKKIFIVAIVILSVVHIYFALQPVDPIHQYFNDEEYRARVDQAVESINKKVAEANESEVVNVSCEDVLQSTTTSKAERQMLEADYKSCTDRDKWSTE